MSESFGAFDDSGFTVHSWHWTTFGILVNGNINLNLAVLAVTYLIRLKTFD